MQDMQEMWFNPWLGRSAGGGHGNSLLFLPGECHGQRCLSGYNPQGSKESNKTEGLNTHIQSIILLTLSHSSFPPSSVITCFTFSYNQPSLLSLSLRLAFCTKFNVRIKGKKNLSKNHLKYAVGNCQLLASLANDLNTVLYTCLYVVKPPPIYLQSPKE